MLSQINGWSLILSFTEKILFKEFEFLKTKVNTKLKPSNFFEFDENKLKMKYINKKLSNVDFNEYLVHHFIVSSHFLKKYENYSYFLELMSDKMNLYDKYFKSEYHYVYWIISYLYICIDYCGKLSEQNLLSKNELNKCYILLYSLCIKYYKKYIYKYKKDIFVVPNKKILSDLIKNVNNSNNIKE